MSEAGSKRWSAAQRGRWARPVVLLDGALGTALEQRGIDLPAPLWSTRGLFQFPQVVREVHAEHARVGVDVLTANTFRTNPRALRKGQIAQRGPELNRLAITLAREALQDAAKSGVNPEAELDIEGILVAASVAPVEECYAPDKVPDDRTLRDEHLEFAAQLADAGADLVWIETMNTVREAVAALEAARAVDLPAAISFVTRSDGSLLGGESLESAVRAITGLEPLAIGINCVPATALTAQISTLAALVKMHDTRAMTRIAAYGHLSCGEPIPHWEAVSGHVTPSAYAELARTWHATGATVLGGCCGTTAAHIEAVRDVADGLVRGGEA